MTSSKKEKIDAINFGLDTMFKQEVDDQKRILVLGPDAFSMVDDGGCEPISIYDHFVKTMLDDLSLKDDYEKYDVFLAAEMWKKKKHISILSLNSSYNKMQEECMDKIFPIIDKVTELPFDIYLTIGFDDILLNKLKEKGRSPRKVKFTNGKLRTKRDSDDSSSYKYPLVGNILGSISDNTAINTYEKLSYLIPKMSDSFFDNKTYNEIESGRLFFIGVQLRFWYMGILLQPFVQNKVAKDSNTCEIKKSFNSMTEKGIKMYLQSAGNIDSESYMSTEIDELLLDIYHKHKVGKVFISYRHLKDRLRMQYIQEVLNENNIIPTISDDFRESIGEKWRLIRERYIVESDVMIAIVSEDLLIHQNSDCYEEIRIAINNRKIIIPVIYDGISISNSFPMLSPYQKIDSLDDLKIDINLLIRRINEIIRVAKLEGVNNGI